MNRKSTLTTIVLLFVCIIAIGVHRLPKEPVYQGVHLEKLLVNQGLPDWKRKAREALLNNKRESIEWLLSTLQTRDLVIKQSIRAKLDRYSPKLGTWVQSKSLLRDFLRPAAERRQAALIGFELLGPHASEAVPDILEMASEHRSRGIKVDAIKALELMGTRTEGVVAGLIRLSNDQDDEVQDTAIIALGNLEHEAAEAIPALRPLLSHQNATVRFLTRHSLRKLRRAATIQEIRSDYHFILPGEKARFVNRTRKNF